MATARRCIVESVIFLYRCRTKGSEKVGKVLRQLALNEVFVGEKDPCRASVLRVSLNFRSIRCAYSQKYLFWRGIHAELQASGKL